MYVNEEISEVKVGQKCKLEVLLDYAHRNNCYIITQTIFKSIPTIPYQNEIIINDIKKDMQIYHKDNLDKNVNIIYAELSN